MKKFLMMTFGAVCLAGLVASSSAIEITYATRGIGEWTPANEFNSDAGVLEGVKRAVDIWNGDALEGSYTLGDTATFTKGAGTLVPANLNLPTAYEDRVEDDDLNGWAGLNNSSGDYQYVTAKYGKVFQQVFYIGDLLEAGITLPANLPGDTGNALSHVSWLRGTPVERTPDGGSMIVLLGLSLASLGVLRRKIAA